MATLAAAGLPLWYAQRGSRRNSEERVAADAKASKHGPNDQIVMAAIGVGGQGTGIMNWAQTKGRRQVCRGVRSR